jgi:hypothetical protein
MGQFKPMVKMMTTEPSVELKLKKGGSVKSMTKMKSSDKGSGHKKMADGGGALSAIAGTPALVGRPAVNAPVRTPGKPSMAARRKAMTAKPKTPMMKNGGETEKEHKAEMKKMSGLKKELKSHESKPASKAHAGLKTGGVANGQGGYKKGGMTKKYAKGGLAKSGIINTENQGGEYRNTKMHTAEYTGKTSGKTGGVKEGNAGGYKTGGVALGNGGGYKAGGKAKKAYAAGGTVDSGHPVAMPQGRKKPSTPVSINQLSGTFKSGGKVTPAQGRLQKAFKAENKTAMKQAKAQSNEVYSKYGKMKMAEGGSAISDEDIVKGFSIDSEYGQKLREMQKMTRESEPAMKGQGKSTDYESEMIKKLGKKFPNDNVQDLLYRFPKGARLPKGVEEALKGMGSVTETERSVTVSPGKKRGGRC